jgi:bifunctional NMN adenylyltransferase/nudix hydrolase
MSDNDHHTLAVFIGRFQPFHIGHLDVLDSLEGEVDSTLMLVGSSYRPRSWKNPFTFAERKSFIEAGTKDARMPIDVLPLIDTLYNDRAWATNVRTAVKLYMRAKGLDEDTTDVVLTGFEKDKSSRYLRWFPEWEMLASDASTHDGDIINATDLRTALFFPMANNIGHISGRFGNRQVGVVMDWMNKHPKQCEEIQNEGSYIRKYRDKLAEAEKVFGFPIRINTADAVVIQSGHVLMVRRGVHPGRGTLALPGGHLNPDETAAQGAMRELREETRLDVPPKLLLNRLRGSKVFDHPERSERGWVRTEAFCFEFEDREEMERVKGGDDAVKALWVPISEITPDEMFEDHFDIVQSFVPEVATSYTSILMAHVGGL